jgi:putative ABC transport system permease protein
LQPLIPGDGYVKVISMRSIVDPRTQSWRLGATLSVGFGVRALLVAAVGLYATIAYDVARRTREIGVRTALGARARDVLRLVVGEAIRFAVIGILIGGAFALAAGRWLAPLLFDVSPTDPAVYGTVTIVLLLSAITASAIPAMRAARVNPPVALRAD